MPFNTDEMVWKPLQKCLEKMEREYGSSFCPYCKRRTFSLLNKNRDVTTCSHGLTLAQFCCSNCGAPKEF